MPEEVIRTKKIIERSFHMLNQRQEVILEIYKLVRDKFEEEDKSLTITFTRGILEEAINLLNSSAMLLPLKLIFKD